MTHDPLVATRVEMTSWFFDGYLPRWVAATAGTSTEGPEFVLDYWGTPMHVTALEHAFWCRTDDEVLAFLELNQASLRDQGYHHTTVPDRRVFVYNTVGGAIEVIWSRRRADESEIQRWATHFNVARGDAGWRVVGIQSVATELSSLEQIWPRPTVEEIDDHA